MLLSLSAAPTEVAALISVTGGPDEPGVWRMLEAELDRRPPLGLRRLDAAQTRAGLACGSSSACLTPILRATGAQRGLRIALDESFSPPLYAVAFFDLERGTAPIEKSGDVSGAPVSALREVLGGLLESAGYLALARVRLSVSPPDATIELPPGATLLPGPSPAFLVPPGKAMLLLKREGYLPQQAVLEATLEHDTEATLELLPEASTSVPWVWVGVAVATVAVATTTALVIGLSSSGPRCLCLSSAGAACPPCP